MNPQADGPGPIHHVGFVVRTLATTEPMYALLGYRRCGDVVEDSWQQADILFAAREGASKGEPLVELVCPRSEQSPVYAFSRESRLRIHHVCFAVDDIDATLASLVSGRRMQQVTPIVAAPAIGDRRIVFLFSRQTGLFELVERPPF